MSNLPPPAQPQSTPAPTSRRGAGARKRAAQADDAAYHAAAGTKRGAPERADGDRDRVKRKRVDASAGGVASGADKEDKGSLIDFTTLPSDALHRYLACFDLIPELDPSPLSAEDPGQPSSLLRPKSHIPPHGHALRRTSTASPGPGPMPTAANRPRRDPGASRRRSSRLVEEERIPAPPPLYSDLSEVDGMLATIAERHFREQEVKEVDTLAAFMCAVKAKSMFRDLS
ncbi:hypothetical protein K466DRAFT_492642 [Polyporus arcularius HHB13444]|uniref:Histone deacetylase complex subunit SAP30 Sin3 binding domain-containing protein n=2 Tax=Polyporaceae TaxID=5317 RepID=A0A5C3PE66_9APHY|nr:hypothetical protein OH76DRAFT_1463220 [Polyporus brumalis]TFK86530.1 hypothetical protein K466DRAFT_492642 [Polyporus arcularius HHB13444]